MQIIISLVGKDQSDLLSGLCKTFSDCNCKIIESRSMRLVGEFSGFWLVEGNWNHVAKLESSLDHLEQRYGVKINSHQVGEASANLEYMPYIVDVFGVDTNGIVSDIIQFFASHNIIIQELVTNRVQSSNNNADLFTAHIVIGIPTDCRPISLRDDFLEYCDSRSLDAILEPIKR